MGGTDTLETENAKTSLPHGELPKQAEPLVPPQSPKEKLEKFFDNRPSPTELKQRNILKDSKVAPALQSAQAELERKRLEDELSAKLSIRPKPDDLVEQHILAADEVPYQEPVQSPQEKLEKFFERRPSLHELEERNILKDTKVAPALQSTMAELEKARLEDDLAKKLASRPPPASLIKEHILKEDEDPTKTPKE